MVSILGISAFYHDSAAALIQDGRLLRHALDPAADRLFLEAIDRAELVLEEVAAVEEKGGDANITLVQSTIQDTGLADRLSAVNIESEMIRSLTLASRLAAETTLRKEYF